MTTKAATKATPKPKDDGNIHVFSRHANPAEHDRTAQCSCGPRLVGLPTVEGGKRTHVLHR